jgi:4-diphosphocytidyl-2-C-methyl-D-erythritol kinase
MPAIAHLRAHAKLTRSLKVVGRRSDGFHLIESEMVSLDLCDELEISEADDVGLTVIDAITWRGSGKPVPLEVPAGADNLVQRALCLAQRRARVRLLKRIPPGGGLGGGSADAAAVLRWAGWDDLEAASRLGADVPFCLVGGRAQVSGIGERLEPRPFVEEFFVVVTPPFGVSSAATYRAFDDLGAGSDEVAGTNDLELAACSVEPRLARWRSMLGEVARRPPLLAGSGSSWFFPCSPEEGARLVDEVADALTAAKERGALSLCRAVAPEVP